MGNAAVLDPDSARLWHEGTPKTPDQSPIRPCSFPPIPTPGALSPDFTWELRGLGARRAGRGAGMGAGTRAPWEEDGHVTPAAGLGCRARSVSTAPEVAAGAQPQSRGDWPSGSRDGSPRGAPMSWRS